MGRWQAEGRNEADFATRCRMDISQLRSQSPVAAVVLAARTVRSVLTSRGSW